MNQFQSLSGNNNHQVKPQTEYKSSKKLNLKAYQSFQNGYKNNNLINNLNPEQINLDLPSARV